MCRLNVLFFFRNHVRMDTHYVVVKSAKRAAGIFNNREKQSEADRLKAYKKQDELKKKKDIFDKDVWTLGSLKEQRPEFQSQWIDRNVEEHNLCNTGTPVAGAPKSAYHKRSQLK